jgi:hypothetical protein
VTDDHVWRFVCERADETRRRGRVRDSHVARDEQRRAGGHVDRGVLGADGESPLDLFARHGRPAREIGGTCSNANIDDREPRARAAREHVDRRAAAREIGDHLRCHFAGVRRHAVGGDAVVGGEHGDRRGERRRNRAPLARREPAGQLLESSERALRLRKRGLARERRGERSAIGSGNHRLELHSPLRTNIVERLLFLGGRLARRKPMRVSAGIRAPTWHGRL